MASVWLVCVLVASSLLPLLTSGQVYLRADGSSNTYGHIDSVMGGSSTEVPDCGHSGSHIYQGNDGTLNHQVFFFAAHRDQDDDRCINADRQRTEIKTNKDNLQGYHGETVSHSWSFKLDADFKPSTGFTHIHQLKAVGGNEKQPLITITPRKGSPNSLQIIHIDSNDVTTHLGSTSLDPFLGTWVHAVEEATYWTGGGHYSIRFKRVSDNSQIWSLEKSNLDLWRSDNSYIRPKWGIYRSLSDKSSLRDEVVRYDNFCVAKGSAKCT